MKTSKKIVKVHDKARDEFGSILLDLLQSTGLIGKCDTPPKVDFHYEGDSILRITFSISSVEIQIPEHKLEIDNLEIDFIFDITNTSMVSLNVKSDGIKWDIDEDVSEEQFNKAEKQIQKILEREILQHAR